MLTTEKGSISLYMQVKALLLARIGNGDWSRMKKYVTDDYGLERDKFNIVRPSAPLKCDAISIRILPQVGFCMGVHEIQLEFDE